MVVLSHAVVSVFTLTVLLIVFNFDVTQSADTIKAYKTCQECIDSTCHKEDKHPCAQTLDGTVLCFKCERSPEGDEQFHSKTECENNCQDKSKCTCDYSCWVCVKHGNATAMCCDMPKKVYDDTCKEVPYNP
ncbi:uncharacterized protein LOC132922463 [Rhopalosiphum padi]|uniref:uncharacterized protein LOC132922463 n=1 Tax=Rhopalosiphum padi TaxID=40932 RepID=UPI00298D9055|nr:uncharacterized protein LOC132922463 [Rhopalosiphum padi]